MSTMNVRLLNAALDEHEGRIVLRGVLDSEVLDAVLVDTYQREISPESSLARIMRGFEQNSAVPDVELGMRGTRKSTRDGIYTLLDDTYVIDGLQRINAAKLFKTRGGNPHLGATVHFGTDRDWERKQFKILNADRTRVSSNVLLRNFGEDWQGIAMLHRLSGDSGFVMQNRVCWDQRPKVGQFVSAMTYVNCTIILHSHATGMIGASRNPMDACGAVQASVEKVGARAVKENVRSFFGLIDTCWNIKRVAYAEKATFLKATFLHTLARVLSNHAVFWRENRLFVESDLTKKLSQFPFSDPTVQQLSMAGSKVDRLLYELMVDHMNKGKRTRRLVPRVALTPSDEAESQTETGQLA
jgi:hypothetical protein